MKTLVGTPDPPEEPEQPVPAWMASAFRAFRPRLTSTVSWTSTANTDLRNDLIWMRDISGNIIWTSHNPDSGNSYG